MPIRVYKDGRTKRSGLSYTRFRREIHALQHELCSGCGRPTSLTADLEAAYSFHVDHRNGRGMGGSKRDDTLEACTGLCGACHRKKHNQS